MSDNDLLSTALSLREMADKKLREEDALTNIESALAEMRSTLDDPRYKDAPIVDTSPNAQADYAGARRSASSLGQDATKDLRRVGSSAWRAIEGDPEIWGTTESRTAALDKIVHALKNIGTDTDISTLRGPAPEGKKTVGWKEVLGMMAQGGAFPLDKLVPTKRPIVAETFDKADRSVPEAISHYSGANEAFVDSLLPKGSNERDTMMRLTSMIPFASGVTKAAAGTRLGTTAATKARPLLNAAGKPLKIAGMKADEVLAATGRRAQKGAQRLKDAATARIPPELAERGAAINPTPYVLKGGKRASDAYKAFRDYGREVWSEKVFSNVERWLWQETPEIIGEALGTTIPSTIRDVLKEGFGSLRARVGEAVYHGLMETRIAPVLAEADALRIGKTLANLTDDQAREATRYMRPRVVGEKAVRPAWATDDQIAALDEWKGLIFDELDEAVRLGKIRPDTRQEYIEGYLFRQFENPEFRQAMGQKGPTNPLHYSKDAYGAVVKMESEEAARTLMRGAGGDAALDAAKVGDKGERVLVKFKDAGSRDEFMRRYRQAYGKGKVYDKFDPIPEDRLKELGEVIDPRANVYQTLRRLRQDNAKLRLYKAIDEQGMAFSPEDKPNWAKTTIPNSPRWGALKGKSVRPDIYRELTAVDKTLMGTGNRIWAAMLAKWKSGKTVMSARTHARNFMGNGPFSVLADNTAPWFGGLANWKYYRQAVKDIRGKSGLWREMVESGIIGTQYADEELKILGKFFDTAHMSGPEKLGNQIANLFTKDWTGPVGRKAARLYNFEDALYRAATYVKARKHWGWDARKATQHVDRFFPNYANVGQVVKRLSMHPLGAPFSRFQNEAIRILYNGIKHRPIKTAAMFYAGVEGLPQLAKATTGMSDAEYEGIRSRGPMALPMFWRNEDGNVETLATDYIFPWGTSMSGLLGTQYNRDEDVKRFFEIVGPMVGQNPVFTSLAGVTTGVDPFTGRDIVRKGERSLPAKARFVGENIVPGLFGIPGVGGGREFNKIVDTVKGRPFASGEDRTPARTILDILTGLNPRPYDPENEANKWWSIMGGVKAKASKDIRSFEKTQAKHEDAGYRYAEQEAKEGIKATEEIQGEKYLAAEIMYTVTTIIEYERALKEESHPGKVSMIKRSLETEKAYLKELREMEERGEGVLPVR